MQDGSAEIQVRAYEDGDESQVIALWKECGLITSKNNPQRDIARKREVDPDLFLVGVAGDMVVACVMAGYEGHRGWLNYLAESPEFRRHGLGRRMVDEAEARLRARGCPKINLQVRTTNLGVIAFYERIGFTVDDAVSLGKRLEDDPPCGGQA